MQNILFVTLLIPLGKLGLILQSIGQITFTYTYNSFKRIPSLNNQWTIFNDTSLMHHNQFVLSETFLAACGQVHEYPVPTRYVGSKNCIFCFWCSKRETKWNIILINVLPILSHLSLCWYYFFSKMSKTSCCDQPNLKTIEANFIPNFNRSFH